MWYRVKAYLNYRLKARSNLYVHSPFVFELTESVLKDQRWFYAFDEIEEGYGHNEGLRKRLRAQNKTIEVSDYGAGSHKGKKKQRKISEIVRNAAIAPKYGQLLFRLVSHFKPKVLLEMGTSLGISTLYQAKANNDTKVITIEGCPQTSQWAQISFKYLRTNNVILKTGTFNDVLPKVFATYPSLDFVYLDGHHEKEATLNYFEQLLPHLHKDSILILDDIHWSKGMHEAWEQVIAHPKVKVSIDLFQVGLVFFREEQVKEHFVLRY